MKRPIRILAFVLVSAVIHMGVSHLLEGMTVSGRTYEPVQVSLVSQKAPEKTIVTEPPKPEPKPQPRPKPKPEPKPAPEPEPVPEPEPQKPLEVPEEAAEPVIQSEPSALEEPSHEISTVDSRMVAAAYERQVAEIIRRNLQYPANARRRGIEGTVLVRFVIEDRGRTADILIVQSSGAPILDRNALETIVKCSFPPPPGGSVELSLPITFRLIGER